MTYCVRLERTSGRLWDAALHTPTVPDEADQQPLNAKTVGFLVEATNVVEAIREAQARFRRGTPVKGGA